MDQPTRQWKKGLNLILPMKKIRTTGIKSSHLKSL
jgi:hypothetical protein